MWAHEQQRAGFLLCAPAPRILKGIFTSSEHEVTGEGARVEGGGA